MKGADDWVSWLLVAALGVIWGGSLTMTSIAVADLPPLTVATGRIVVAAAASFALATVFAGGLPPWGRIWLFALGAAVAANAAPFALLAWAQGHISGGLAAICMATMPLIVLPMAAAFVPGERMTRLQLLGCLLGVAGVAYLIGVDALFELGGDAVQVAAQLACVGAATGYAAGSILAKNAPPTEPIAFAAATLLLATAFMVPLTLATEAPFDPRRAWTASAIGAVVFVGLIGTALTTVLLLIVLRRAGPSFLSTVNFQIPIWAMLFGALFLGETIPVRAPLALAIIFAGVAVSQFGDRWARSRPSVEPTQPTTDTDRRPR